MKNLLIFAIFLFANTVLNAQNFEYENSFALLIGNSKYQNGWDELKGVVEDITEIEKCLKNEHSFTVFVKNNLKTKAEIDAAISIFIRDYGQNEKNRLLIYFAGHGYTSQKGNGYIVPTNAPNPNNTKEVEAESYLISNFQNYALTISSKHVLFIFDACFAGSIFRAVPVRRIKEAEAPSTLPVREFISSGGANEVVKDKSDFRKEFIYALSSDAADFNKDGMLTASELGLYLKEKVAIYTNKQQNPQFGKLNDPEYNKGDFVFFLGKSEKPSKPKFKPGKVKISYGKISLNSDFAGNLFLDNESLGYVQQNSEGNMLEEITTKTKHSIEIRDSKGNVLWKQNVEVVENETKNVFAKNESPTEFTESVTGMRFVLVKGGTFQMGSNDADAEADEKPVHQVTVSDYYVATTEVTQKQWREVMGQDPPELCFKGCDNCPVERVSWEDCQEFIQKLNAKTGKKFRLPTEAEWEFAAKGGNKSKNYKYAGSNNVDEVAWYNGNSGSKTHSVGSKKANELGLYDMSGNVWEWCQDWYGSYSSSTQTNPTGPTTGRDRLLRGGSWDFNARLCRSAYRFSSTPTFRNIIVGFRLVLFSAVLQK